MAGEDETIDVLVHLRDELSRAAERIDRSIDGMKRSAAEAAPVMDELGNQIDDAGDAAAKATVKTGAYNRELKQNKKQAAEAAVANEALARSLNKHSARAGGKGWFGALTGSMQFGKFLKMALIPTILDAISTLTTLASAAAAASIGAVASLAPLTGLLAAYPGYLAAIGQGFGVFKLATSGLSDAIGLVFQPGADPAKLKEAMKGLTPAARAFVTEIAKFKKPFTDMKTAVQSALLPAMSSLLGIVRAYLPMVQTALTTTAHVMSASLRGLGDYLKLAQTQQRVGIVMANNTNIIGSFGRVAKSGIQLLVNILVAAGPMLVHLADQMADFFAGLAYASGSGNGLAKFFQSTESVAQRVLKFTEDISMAIFNIGKIGVPLGHEMGDSWMEMAKNFRHFTESSDGIDKIRNWFKEMRPVIYEVGYLVRDIGKAFAKWPMEPSVIKTLRSLRMDTLPEIIKMVDSAAGRFLPAIAKALGAILNIITNLFVLPGLLDIIANTLNNIATIIMALPDPLKSIISLMLTLTTLFKVTGTIGFIKGIVGGAAGGAAGMGVLAKSAAGAKAAVGGVGFALAAVRGGAATAAEGVGFLATAGFGKLKAAALALSGALKVGVILVLVAMVAAFVQAGFAADEMEKKFAKAREEFGHAPNQGTWSVMRDQINDTIDAFDNYNSHNPLSAIFDGDVWKDTVTNIKNGWESMFGGPRTETIQERRAKQIRESQLQLAQYQKTVAWVASSTGTSTDRVQEAMEKLKIDPTKMSIPEINKAVKSYVWLTYQADEQTRIVAESLNTLADSASTASEKVTAFKAALDAMQPDKSYIDSLIAVKKNIEAIATATQGSKFFKAGETKIDARTIKKYGAEVENLHNTMKTATGDIDALTTARYKETGSIPAAVAAYGVQWRALRNNIQKGYEDAGFSADVAYDKANALMKQYMLTPQQVDTYFNQPNVREALNNGKTLDWVLRNIPATVKTTFTVGTFGLVSLESRVDRITAKLRNMNKAADGTGMAEGGFAFAGSTHPVGERGPELFVGANGDMRMIGLQGQETMTFPTDGYVIPNDKLPVIKTTPQMAMAGAAPEARAAIPDLPPVQVGPVYVNEPIDLERAVSRGIRRSQRDRAERGG